MTSLLREEDWGKGMESCSFSTFLIFLWILSDYLDQLMLSSVIKDLMDPLLSVDYT